MRENLHMSGNCSNFASKIAKTHTRIMEETLSMLEKGFGTRMHEPMHGNYGDEVYYTREEFMNELAKQLGQAYGLNDIREAR